ncbi:hypothetical protein B0T10DRAFT_556148 [Thelonectria olida]|uniref:Uncharacterized protein n=1 Tax=Thelonectria olida TaxID=1576542 RepID=A0A9P8WIZ4_9HYPO|nr:hypothetical protein B0T10DRAFT_556148 [Thelonectria olida]
MTTSEKITSKTSALSTSIIRSREGDTPSTLPSDESDGDDLPMSIPSKTDKGKDESTGKNDKPSKTMTDSGVTHTIPNQNPVTITKHTLIITDKSPTPTPSSTLSSLDPSLTTSTSSPEATLTESTVAGVSPDDAASSSPSTGMIAGVSIGGAIALGICTFLLIRYFRRSRRVVAISEGRFSIDAIRDSDNGEKNYLQVMSPHTTGTQGSGDPFAPFGGRADMPHDPLRPPVDTFEMDGTSTAPVELPAETHSRASMAPYSQDVVAQQHPVQPTGPVDPRANLNASLTDRHQNTYVNHWNQYRNLGPER